MSGLRVLGPPSLPSAMSSHYSLQVIRAAGFDWKHTLHGKVPSLYAELRLGEFCQKTGIIKKSTCPTWDESFVLPSCDASASLEIQVKHNSAWIPDPCIGIVKESLDGLLAKSAHGEATLSLSTSDDSSLMQSGYIVLRLEVIDELTGADMCLVAASEDIRRGKFRRTEDINDVTQSINQTVSQQGNQGDLYNAVGSLIAKLEAFQQVMTTLSEIHPFLTIAWKMASALYSAVRRVFDTDQKIIDLVRNMNDAFSFVREVETLPDKTIRLQLAIVGLLKQTVECCLFVSKYAKRGFLRRMVDITSSLKIDEFQQALASFKQQIESGVVLHIALVSTRTPQKIDDLVLRERLNPSSSDAFDRPVCLTDTRVEIRQTIVDWIYSENEQNIFWLHGVAGSGKSTVSTTIAQHFRDISRLGAFLCFERGKSEPASVIRTLAYKLALFDGSIAESLLEEIDKDKDISTMRSEDQFRKLLLEPLKAASSMGPILVVLDALDECGTSNTRNNLMHLLEHELPKLPKNFRFLLTSRREMDIDNAFSSQSATILAMELDYTSSTSQEDVLSYLRVAMRSALTRQITIPVSLRWDESISSLGRAAGGLFVWASTAVKLVYNSDNPFRTFKDLVTDSRSLTGFGLNDLYATVLRDCGIVWNNFNSRSRFVGVLSLVLFSKIPLSSETMDSILSFQPEESSHLVLSRLRCLLSYSPGEPVRLLHASFGDYLTSLEHSNELWYIDSLVANRLILDRCFSVMESMLHFNMCDLETSFVSNSNVPGLKSRVEAHIPPHLEYVCIHWAHHLRNIPCIPDVAAALDEFGHRRLLFWFEVLSLTGMFGRVANSALRGAFEWTEANNADLAAFLRDAADLATIFAVPITESTPHIYVTMIPLSKDESMVSAHYSRQMSSLVQVQRSGSKRPLKYMRVLEGHSGFVPCVAVSPDGRLVASGSWDGTIRVGDFHGGEEERILQNGGRVESVKFLPDGRHVVSISEASEEDSEGDSEEDPEEDPKEDSEEDSEGDSGEDSEEYILTVWDIHTGDLVHSRHHFGRPVLSSCGTRAALVDGSDQIVVWNVSDGMELLRLTENTEGVRDVALSHGGKLLASHHCDDTVRIWDVKSGKLVFGPYIIILADELIFSFCPRFFFSPDGKYLMCLCIPRVIVLKLDDGSTVFDFILENGFSLICSAAYSPCGTRIAIGSGHGDALVLDATTGEVVSGPSKLHTVEGTSVTFTPDGRHIISGSHDGTVRIWDTSVGNINSETFEGYGNVDWVIISDDGSRVASVHRGDIVVWDVVSGDVITCLLNPGEVDIGNMAFSPDNSRLVSTSWRRIKVWDVETSQLLFDPIECPDTVQSIAISPDGTSVASGDDGRAIMVWTLATGQPIAGPLRTNSVDSLEFSPDGRRLALGTRNGKVLMWSTESWQVILELSTGCDGDVYSICFSPDSTQLASIVNDHVIAWDMEHRRILLGPWESCGQDGDLVFTWSGLHIISPVDRSGILVEKADAEGLRTIYELQDFRGGECVACSKDSSRVVSWVYNDHQAVDIRVWDVPEILRNQEERRPDSSSKRTLRDDGWVAGGRDGQDLLIWIPHNLRETLHPPRVTLLNTGSGFSTEVDFAGAALGDQWTTCFTAPQ